MHLYFLWLEFARLAVKSCNSESNHENSDSEFVELEKSNVLLMGPTGSGIAAVQSVSYFSVMCDTEEDIFFLTYALAITFWISIFVSSLSH